MHGYSVFERVPVPGTYRVPVRVRYTMGTHRRRTSFFFFFFKPGTRVVLGRYAHGTWPVRALVHIQQNFIFYFFFITTVHILFYICLFFYSVYYFIKYSEKHLRINLVFLLFLFLTTWILLVFLSFYFDVFEQFQLFLKYGVFYV